MIKNLKQICSTYDTPIYIYRQEIIENQIQILKEIFPSDINIFYSIKANPNIHILKIIKEKVFGFEACSMGEVYIALKAGISADRIIFVGPAKREDELNFAINHNISMIVAESENEVNCINQIAEKQGKIIDVSLRINPLRKFGGSHIKMGGESKQFGIDEEKITDIYERVNKLKNIKIVGIHCYCGTQNFSAEVLAESMTYILDVAYNFQNYIKTPLRFIDLGGGLGVPYNSKSTSLDTEKLEKILKNVFNDKQKNFHHQCKFCIESGRFIVSQSAVFICKIIDRKVSREKNYILVDGGTNCSSSSYNSGHLLRSNPIIYGLENNSNKKILTDVVGPLCTPTDYLAQNVMLSEDLSIGEHIVIENSGAYGYSAASKDFLSHSYPAEVLCKGDEIKLIRRRSVLEDMLRFY